MPAQYDAIKRSEMKSGKSKKVAERIAAATYNKNRPAGAVPVTRNYDKTVAKRKAKHDKIKKGLRRAFPED